MCRSECNKTRKVMPLLLKKMGLSKGEISKKMKVTQYQVKAILQ